MTQHSPPPTNEAFLRAEMIREVMPLVLVGIIFAATALLLIPYPTPTVIDGPLTTLPHLEGVLAQLQNPEGKAVEGGLGLVLPHLLIYLALLGAGVAFVGGLFTGGRRWLWALLGLGALGLVYVSRFAVPFTSPMIGVCGFAVILCGAVVGLAVSQANFTESPIAEPAPAPNSVPVVSETSSGNY
jgi:hypothetical protein